MIEHLTQPLIQIIGTSIVSALALILILLNKKLTGLFVDKLWSKITGAYKHKLKGTEIAKDTKIREILIELRTIVKADRSCLFQFHNGNVFTTKNPIWKMSNTHESVAPGISSEIRNLQDIKASCLIETLQCFWDDKKLPIGIEKISPEYCHECTSACKNDGKKVILIDVNKLEDSYSRSLLIEQGITYVLDVPLCSGGNCVGFVSANYCGEHNIEEVKNHAQALCRHAAQIQFVLLN